MKGRILTQDEFQKLYDRLARLADARSKDYFHDEGQRQDAIFEALDRFVDNAGFRQVGSELVYDPSIKDIGVWGKTVIKNSLKNSRKAKHELEPIILKRDEKELVDDHDSFHGMELNG